MRGIEGRVPRYLPGGLGGARHIQYLALLGRNRREGGRRKGERESHELRASKTAGKILGSALVLQLLRSALLCAAVHGRVRIYTIELSELDIGGEIFAGLD